MESDDKTKRTIEQGHDEDGAGKNSETKEALSNIRKSNSNSLEALYDRASELKKEHDFGEAQKVLDDALKQYPDDSKLLVEQALLYVDQNQHDKALEIYVKRNDSGGLLQLIKLLRSQPAFSGDEAKLAEALGDFRHDPVIRGEFGWIFYEHGQYKTAIQIFDEVLQNYEHNGIALQGKLASLRLQRRFKEAKKLHREVAEHFPDHFGIQSELGWIYFDQKQY